MAKKKAELPAGWVLTVEVEETETEPGDYRAFKFVQGIGTIEHNAQSLEELVAGAEDYDRLSSRQEEPVQVEEG